MKVALLSAGKDKPYAVGITKALLSKGLQLDFIGNDAFENEAVFANSSVTYFNLRGDQTQEADLRSKIVRVLKYYAKLIKYTSNSSSTIFHVLWLNKFLFFDSTLLNIFYKLKGKKIVYTAHNVNMKKRDGGDNFLNWFSLYFLYNFVDHIIVHTRKMKEELCTDFRVRPERVTVIPFPLNDTVPSSDSIDSKKAKEILELNDKDFVLMFFGWIAPYKGLDILIDAAKIVIERGYPLKVLIAGEIKYLKEYWDLVEKKISAAHIENSVIKRIEFIPDHEIEIYFKAADALALPYRFIYQSGPLFLSYYFGLPVIATNVGSFEEDIVEGETGVLATGADPVAIADAIAKCIDSELYKKPEQARKKIIRYAREKYSWSSIAETILKAYRSL
jgi:glycosyltransferase involved in cell wall biosynthesis